MLYAGPKLENAAGTDAFATGGGGSDPTDPSAASWWVDDFIFLSNETGEVGALGWSFTNGSCVGVSTAVSGRPGVVRRTSGTTANQVASFYTGSAIAIPASVFGDIDELTFIVSPGATNADFTLRVGLFNDASVLGNPVGAHFERLSTDTNWFAKTVEAGPTAGRTDTGVALTTGWFRLKIQRVSNSEWGFTIDGGSEITRTANVPASSTNCIPGIQIIPTTTTARFVDVDFASAKYRAISR